MTSCLHPLCDPEHTTGLVVVRGACSHPLCFLYVDSVVGGYGGGVTPGPMPNPEAKPSSADGTALARVWESRSPPTFNVEVGPV